MKPLLNELSKRQQIILKNCDICGEGLEIGPSFNPVAPKKKGFNVKIIDHLDRKGLIEKYTDDPNVPSDIEEIIEDVDYVWSGQSYVELIGKEHKFDYIISSHLIEHVPNLILHLKDCSELLKPNGIYSLAVPDKRYTFDLFRQPTTAKDCVNIYFNDSDAHSRGSLVDDRLNVVSADGRITWAKQEAPNNFSIVHSIEEAAAFVQTGDEGKYCDIHESVFTPSSFVLLISDLNCLGFIDFTVVSLDEAQTNGEFYVTLKKSSESSRISNEDRLILLKRVMLECMEPFEHEIVNHYMENILDRKEVCVSEGGMAGLLKKNREKMGPEYCIDRLDISDNTYLIMGWVKLDDKFNMSKVYIKIQNYYYTGTCLDRLDVAESFHLQNTRLGFSVQIPKSVIQKLGGGKIEIVAVDENDKWCSFKTDNYVGD